MNAGSLADQAQAFAARLTTTVQAVVPGCSPFRSRLIEETSRFNVHQDPDTGIPLTVNGRALLTLKVDYRCCLDGVDRFLAVETSHVKVFPGAQASGEPLFRFEYEREPRSDIAAAHIQIHAHRDAITYVMTSAGSGSQRGRRRVASSAVPRLSELHFPVGGHRFRPCLEDVLEMLVSELGVDCPRTGREALRDGREAWRRTQVKAAVRDAPADAVDVLRGLGYIVEPPPTGHAQDHPSRLREI